MRNTQSLKSQSYLLMLSPLADSSVAIAVAVKPRRGSAKQAMRGIIEQVRHLLHRADDGCYMVARQQGEDVQPTKVVLPDNVMPKLDADTDLKDELSHFLDAAYEALSHKDAWKIHLKKEAPNQVNFAYTINGGPNRSHFVDPQEVNVEPSAFNDELEHASFHDAVIKQNFNNAAYKKWREQIKQKYVDNILSAELHETYGDETALSAWREEQERIKAVHQGIKQVLAGFVAEEPMATNLASQDSYATNLINEIVASIQNPVSTVDTTSFAESQLQSPSYEALAKEDAGDFSWFMVSTAPQAEDIAEDWVADMMPGMAGGLSAQDLIEIAWHVQNSPWAVEDSYDDEDVLNEAIEQLNDLTSEAQAQVDNSEDDRVTAMIQDILQSVMVDSVRQVIRPPFYGI